jgi:hypothetical protein
MICAESRSRDSEVEGAFVVRNDMNYQLISQVRAANLRCVAYPESVLFRHGKVGAA